MNKKKERKKSCSDWNWHQIAQGGQNIKMKTNDILSLKFEFRWFKSYLLNGAICSQFLFFFF